MSRASNDDTQNENQAEGVATSSTREPSQEVNANHDESSSTPESSTGSFELVSSVRSVDAVPMGTLAFDEVENDYMEIPNAIISPDARDSSIDECNGMIGADTMHERHSKPSSSKAEQDIPKHETIIQCLLRLHKEQTLYKGASHMVTTLMISNGIFFYALQKTRRRLALLQHHNLHQRNHGRKLHPNFKDQLTNYLLHMLPKSKMGNSLLASSLAGAINVLLTNPLWVASLRIMESKVPVQDDSKLQQQQQQTLWSIMQGIARNEGISHLWNGTYTSLLLVSNPIIQHFIYEQLRLWLLESRGRRYASRGNGRRGGENNIHAGRKARSLKLSSLSPLEALFFGALAKAAATVITYPLQLAQVLLRLQRKKVNSSPMSNEGSSQHGSSNKGCSTDDKDGIAFEGTLDCLYQQFSSGGIPALFQGMNAKLLQTVLTAAFTFLTYEQTLTRVGRVYETLGSKR